MSKQSGIPATFGNFLLVLDSAIFNYDAKQCDKEAVRGIPNIYRLGQLLEASHKVRTDLSHLDLASVVGPLTSVVMRSSLQSRFSPGFPPVNRVLRQLDAWIETGKLPTLL
jgi:hypothetical protein